VKKRTDDLDWDDVQVFLALARHESLSAAARTLGVNHATIGRRIDSLERRVGGALFERGARGYAPTPLARTLLPAAEAMEAGSHAFLRGAGRAGPGLAGTVRLTATEALASVFLAPRLAAAVRELHPGIAVEIATDSRALNLSRREADAALRWARPAGEGSGALFCRRIGTVGYGFYAAEPYLAAHAGSGNGGGDPEQPHDLIGFDDAGAAGGLPEPGWLARTAKHGRIVFRSNSVLAQRAAAEAGAGIAVLPHYLAAGTAGLRPVAMAGTERMTRELWLVVHRDLRDVPRIRAVLDLVAEIVRRERAMLDPTPPS
jgi:DNA-binding transcriptional LysR family regulator